MSQATMPLDAGTGILSPPRTRRRARLLRPALMALGVLALGAGLGWWWLTGGRTVSIDDAYVQADRESVSTDISGLVAQVAVHEGQHVRAGDVLFRLDDAPFRIALDGARAALAQAVLSVEAQKRDYQRALHDVAAREAQVQADQADVNRMSPVVHEGGVARGQYDDARFRLQGDQQAVEALRGQSQVTLARLQNDAQIDPRDTPDVRAAQARVDEAQRELDHTVMHAPFDGIATQVDALQPGQYLPASTAAFGLVSTGHVWAQGFPKETELTWVKAGDPAQVTVDSYPGRVWHGTVESIAPASGSEFSVLPAQNTSGNWVKVVQRVPLRIRLDRSADDPELRAGTSVVIDIDTGHARALHDLL